MDSYESRRLGFLRLVVLALGALGLAGLVSMALGTTPQASAQLNGDMVTICFEGETLEVDEDDLDQYPGHTEGACTDMEMVTICFEGETLEVDEDDLDEYPGHSEGACADDADEDEDEDERMNGDEDNNGNDEDEDERDGRGDDEDENRRDENDVDSVVIIREPVIQEVPVIVQQPPVTQEVIREVVVQQRESQGGGTTSVGSGRITAPSTGDGGLAASEAGSGLGSQLLLIAAGSAGLVALYGFYLKRVRR